MELALNRIIYFTNKMKTMTEFYRDVIGLKPIEDPEFAPTEWCEFAGTADRDFDGSIEKYLAIVSRYQWETETGILRRNRVG